MTQSDSLWMSVIMLSGGAMYAVLASLLPDEANRVGRMFFVTLAVSCFCVGLAIATGIMRPLLGVGFFFLLMGIIQVAVGVYEIRSRSRKRGLCYLVLGPCLMVAAAFLSTYSAHGGDGMIIALVLVWIVLLINGFATRFDSGATVRIHLNDASEELPSQNRIAAALQVELQLTPLEMTKGTRKKVRLPDHQMIEISIPPQVENGSILWIDGTALPPPSRDIAVKVIRNIPHSGNE